MILLFGKHSRTKYEWQHSPDFVHNITFGNMELQNQDFKEFIELLNAHEVKYLITNKKASGRPKDFGDIEGLQQ